MSSQNNKIKKIIYVTFHCQFLFHVIFIFHLKLVLVVIRAGWIFGFSSNFTHYVSSWATDGRENSLKSKIAELDIFFSNMIKLVQNVIWKCCNLLLK